MGVPPVLCVPTFLCPCCPVCPCRCSPLSCVHAVLCPCCPVYLLSFVPAVLCVPTDLCPYCSVCPSCCPPLSCVPAVSRGLGGCCRCPGPLPSGQAVPAGRPTPKHSVLSPQSWGLSSGLSSVLGTVLRPVLASHTLGFVLPLRTQLQGPVTLSCILH